MSRDKIEQSDKKKTRRYHRIPIPVCYLSISTCFYSYFGSILRFCRDIRSMSLFVKLFL